MSKLEFIEQLIDSEKTYITHLRNSINRSHNMIDSLNILKVIVESNNQYTSEVDINEPVYKEINEIDELNNNSNNICNIDTCFDSDTEVVIRDMINSPKPKVKKQRKPRTTKPKLVIDTTIIATT
jgi:hypothetical protein